MRVIPFTFCTNLTNPFRMGFCILAGRRILLLATVTPFLTSMVLSRLTWGRHFDWRAWMLLPRSKLSLACRRYALGLAMYLFVRRLLGRPAGLIAALTYVYIPYHLFDLYVRAAQAESVGFVFVPLVL